ncbi:MAG: hypothetical protein WC554_04315 [Clostridia bacterium]
MKELTYVEQNVIIQANLAEMEVKYLAYLIKLGLDPLIVHDEIVIQQRIKEVKQNKD